MFQGYPVIGKYKEMKGEYPPIIRDESGVGKHNAIA
jgi:hypothetical protein